jgi:4-hydroxy-4-methyl-2-oxoglutarate aldolase
MSVSADLDRAAAAFASATLHEASGGKGALPSALRPVAAQLKLCGRALTVASAPGDNLWIHRALLQAAPGAVLVCTVGGAYEHGYWGEILTVAAIAKGIVGLVIDGGVRDSDRIEALGFPVFARTICIRGTTKRQDAPGAIGEPVRIGDCLIKSGDLIVGDRDGVVVVSTDEVAATLAAAAAREAREADVLARLQRGETTLDVYGWS